MKNAPPLPSLAAAREEGYQAASEGISFRDRCPYAWYMLQSAGVTLDDFNQFWRPVMDAWFNGWKAYLDERGLGFDMTPHGERYGKPRGSRLPKEPA